MYPRSSRARPRTAAWSARWESSSRRGSARRVQHEWGCWYHVGLITEKLVGATVNKDLIMLQCHFQKITIFSPRVAWRAPWVRAQAMWRPRSLSSRGSGALPPRSGCIRVCTCTHGSCEECVYQTLIKGTGPLQGNLMPLKVICLCMYIYIYIYIYVYIYIYICIYIYMYTIYSHGTTLYQLDFDIDKSCTDFSRTLIKGMGPLQGNLMTLKVMCAYVYIYIYIYICTHTYIYIYIYMVPQYTFDINKS